MQDLIERNRSTAVGLPIAAAVLLVTLWRPLDVPFGNLLLSLFPALAAGLTAVALVLMYRTARIINFAQLAMGGLAAQLFYQLYVGEKLLPYGAAIVAAIIGGILVALLIGTIASMLFFRHPRLVMTVVTILFIQLLGEVQQQVNGIFVDPGETQPQEAIIGPFPGTSVTIDAIPFRFAHAFGLFLLIGIALALVVFFKKTRFGTAIRASAENSDRASLLGINVKLLNVFVWAIVGVIASVGQLAIMPVVQYNPTAFFDLVPLLLPLAAAVVARMTSMPIAFFTATGLVVLERGINFATGDSALIQIGLLGILMLGLLLQRKQLSAREQEATSWKATKEPRPTPRALLDLPAIRNARIALLVVLGAIVLLLPWVVGIQTVGSLQFIWLASIIGASLIVLTGWSGQISLGQWAIVTVGAFIGGYSSLEWGLPFLLTIPLGGIIGAAFALLIGIPALRIRGLFLAATTFGIAVVMPLFIFDPKFLGDYAPTQDLERPQLWFMDFENERVFYYLLLGFFLLTTASIRALRKSRAGRILIALRDNEDGVRSFGVDVVKTRLIAFALSGFIAGAGGALLVNQQLGMDQSLFNFQFNVNIFVLVVIGGISSTIGAFLGATYFIAGTLWFPGLVNLITGAAGLIVLMFIPGGLVQVLFGARDAVLRVIAMRKDIVVPSLFEDYSPEAWERRLTPLSPPVQSHGLAALRHDQRYSLPSRVYGGGEA